MEITECRHRELPANTVQLTSKPVPTGVLSLRKLILNGGSSSSSTTAIYSQKLSTSHTALWKDYICAINGLLWDMKEAPDASLTDSKDRIVTLAKCALQILADAQGNLILSKGEIVRQANVVTRHVEALLNGGEAQLAKQVLIDIRSAGMVTNSNLCEFTTLWVRAATDGMHCFQLGFQDYFQACSWNLPWYLVDLPLRSSFCKRLKNKIGNTQLDTPTRVSLERFIAQRDVAVSCRTSLSALLVTHYVRQGCLKEYFAFLENHASLGALTPYLEERIREQIDKGKYWSAMSLLTRSMSYEPSVISAQTLAILINQVVTAVQIQPRSYLKRILVSMFRDRFFCAHLLEQSAALIGKNKQGLAFQLIGLALNQMVNTPFEQGSISALEFAIEQCPKKAAKLASACLKARSSSGDSTLYAVAHAFEGAFSKLFCNVLEGNAITATLCQFRQPLQLILRHSIGCIPASVDIALRRITDVSRFDKLSWDPVHSEHSPTLLRTYGREFFKPLPERFYKGIWSNTSARLGDCSLLLKYIELLLEQHPAELEARIDLRYLIRELLERGLDDIPMSNRDDRKRLKEYFGLYFAHNWDSIHNPAKEVLQMAVKADLFKGDFTTYVIYHLLVHKTMPSQKGKRHSGQEERDFYQNAITLADRAGSERSLALAYWLSLAFIEHGVFDQESVDRLWDYTQRWVNPLPSEERNAILERQIRSLQVTVLSSLTKKSYDSNPAKYFEDLEHATPLFLNAYRAGIMTMAYSQLLAKAKDRWQDREDVITSYKGALTRWLNILKSIAPPLAASVTSSSTDVHSE